jgi:hypothetical protein
MISERVLWHGQCGALAVQCTVAASCAGVELQIAEGGTVTRRERFPDRSTAYERARIIRREYVESGCRIDA